MVESIAVCAAKLNKTHIYIPPDGALKRFIANYTVCVPSVNALFTSDEVSLIPDASGCIVCEFNGEPEFAFWGPTTEIVKVKNDVQSVPLRVFVEFLPGGSHSLLGLPLNELTDTVYPLWCVDNRMEEDIAAAIEVSDDLPGLKRSLDKTFIKRIFDTGNRMVELAFDAGYSVQKLASLTAYSQRQLTRKFVEETGLHCKGYMKLMRVNLAAKLLKAGGLTQTELAQQLDYFDQAHFSRDFKSVCGVTPGEYLKNMSCFYNEEYKF